MIKINIRIEQGDITKLDVDAIVNPANSYGYMGGGVAKAIKLAGGKEIELEAIAQAPIALGSAIVTSGGMLKARYIIHAPTMEKPGTKIDIMNVKEATKAALEKADELGVKKIALPGMGTGIGSVPKDKAALAMLEVIINYNPISIEEIILIDMNADMIKAFNNALKYF